MVRARNICGPLLANAIAAVVPSAPINMAVAAQTAISNLVNPVTMAQCLRGYAKGINIFAHINAG